MLYSCFAAEAENFDNDNLQQLPLPEDLLSCGNQVSVMEFWLTHPRHVCADNADKADDLDATFFSEENEKKRFSMSDCNFYTPRLLCTPKARVVGVA